MRYALILLCLGVDFHPFKVNYDVKTPAAVASTVRVKRVLYFSAVWCGPCQKGKAAITADLINSGKGYSMSQTTATHIQYVDYDLNLTLASHYGVKSLPWIATVDGDKIVDSEAFTTTIRLSDLHNKLYNK